MNASINSTIHLFKRQQSPTQQKSWDRLYKTQNKRINSPLSLSLFPLNKHFVTTIFFQSTAEGLFLSKQCVPPILYEWRKFQANYDLGIVRIYFDPCEVLWRLQSSPYLNLDLSITTLIVLIGQESEVWLANSIL